MKRTGSDDALRCSFCDKSLHQVGTLITSPIGSPPAYICDECVAVCNHLLDHEKLELAGRPAVEGAFTQETLRR